MKTKNQPDLTEGQKVCLRLVGDHHTSKEIARMLDISPFTVDQRLDAARQKLGAASRKEAARLFALMEGGGLSQSLVYDASTLASSTSSDADIGSQRLISFLPVPPFGGTRHDLTKRDIIYQSLSVAFFSALALAAIVTILSGAMLLF